MSLKVINEPSGAQPEREADIVQPANVQRVFVEKSKTFCYKCARAIGDWEITGIDRQSAPLRWAKVAPLAYISTVFRRLDRCGRRV